MLEHMIKGILLVISSVFVIQISYSQGTIYPKGAYKTSLEFKNKKPTILFEFNIEKKTKSDIIMYGGADYWITSIDDLVKKKSIKKEIFAISTGDTLYINCYLQRAQRGYAKVISEGDYIVFMGPVNNGDVSAMSTQGSSSGAVGGALTGAEIAGMRDLYVLDASQSTARPLNRVLLRKILKPYPDLLQHYENEDDMNDHEVMLKYLIFVNEN